MFGRQGVLSGSSSSSSHLAEFRAGRMNMIGKMVHADKRKGMVYLTQSDDGLMHFCWKDRNTGKVEDDLIVFPDDFEFKHVEQCKTGRVYVLKCKTSTRRMFFWMQEPKADKDEELCRRVNELMNNPPSASTRSGSDSGDLQYMLNNMSQQQLMQLFGGVGQMSGLSSLLGSMNRQSENSTRSERTTTRSSGGGNASTPLTPQANPAITLRTPSAPARKGSKSNNGAKSEGGVTAAAVAEALSEAAVAAGVQRPLNIDLSSALTSSEAVFQLILDAERAKTLSVHLPPENTDDADDAKRQQIKDTIASPQFQQALSLFCNALQSAQLGPVVSQFELSSDAVAAAYSGNLEDFVKALEKSLPTGTSMPAEKDIKEAMDESDATTANTTSVVADAGKQLNDSDDEGAE